MTTPSQSSEREETVQAPPAHEIAELLASVICRGCYPAAFQLEGELIREMFEPVIEQRDQAIRERDEARAAVARVEALAKGWECESTDAVHARYCPNCSRASVIRAALSGGAGEQDKAEEGER